MQNTPHVAIVMGAHPHAQMGGAQFQAHCIARHLATMASFRISYLARLVPQSKNKYGYSIYKFGPTRRLGLTRFLPDLMSLYILLKRLNPDIVYQRGLKAHLGLCALYCIRHGKKLVFHAAHDDDVKDTIRQGYSLPGLFKWLDQALGRYGLRRADAIIVQSQDQAKLLSNVYGMQAAAIVRNFHPLPAEGAATHFGNKVFSVIWVANFKPSKQPEEFVAIAEQFSEDSRVHFIMVGRPGNPRKYSTLHMKIESLPNLEYLGELTIEETNRKIAGSNLFVNTSQSEGFPNTFIQSWLRSVPVLSLNVDPDRCLSKGKAGILVDGVDAAGKEIRKLVSDKKYYSKMRSQARHYGLRHHGPEQVTPLIDLLKELLLKS